MNTWSHGVCLACYRELHPGREPGPMAPPSPGMCCRCGGRLAHGIYVRADPASMLCQGTHLHAADDQAPADREPTEAEWNAWKAAVESWQEAPENVQRHQPWEMCDCPLPPQQPWNQRLSGHCAARGPISTWAEIEARRAAR